MMKCNHVLKRRYIGLGLLVVLAVFCERWVKGSTRSCDELASDSSVCLSYHSSAATERRSHWLKPSHVTCEIDVFTSTIVIEHLGQQFHHTLHLLSDMIINSGEILHLCMLMQCIVSKLLVKTLVA